MDTFLVALGDEIRVVRKRKKWTRRDLQRRLPFDVSLQTIATWELGTRHISAERLYLVCLALDEPMEELITRVRARVEGHRDNPALSLDIEAAARTTRARLDPVRAWATCRLREGQSVVGLNSATLDRLADICATTPIDLKHRLTRAGLVRASCDDAV